MIQNHVHTNISYPVHRQLFLHLVKYYWWGRLLQFTTIILHNYFEIIIFWWIKCILFLRNLLEFCNLYFAEHFMFLMKLCYKLPFFDLETAKAVNNFCLFQVLALIKLIFDLNGLNWSFPNVAIFGKIFDMATYR